MPFEEVAEDQPGPYTLRGGGSPPDPAPGRCSCGPCLCLQTEVTLKPHPLGAFRCHADLQAAFGHRPYLLFSASSKHSHVLPAARLAAQPVLQWEAQVGSREEVFEVSSLLTALPSGLPPGKPSAPGVDKHPPSSEEQPWSQKTCSQAWPCWKPLHTIVRGSLQTEVGFGGTEGGPGGLKVPS